MKKLFYFIIMFVVMLMTNCKPTNPNSDDGCNKKCFGFLIDCMLYFRVISEDDIDLLNPENEHSYKYDEIEIWYLYPNGAFFKEYSFSSDIKKGFQILPNGNGHYVMKLMMGSNKAITPEGEHISACPETLTTYIHWNATDVDTVYTEFTGRCGTDDPYDAGYCQMYYYDKVYYNGKLIVPSNSSPCPNIIK